MNTSPASDQIASKITFLRDRAHMLQTARAFFYERGVMEVDCPALFKAAPVATHIDIMQVAMKNGEIGYLHSSTEYGMKRLLAAGIGDTYQISHVFREGEAGPMHNPEFTMAEWYRLGFTFEELIEETLDFIRLFVGALPARTLTYRQAFQELLGIDYVHASCASLASFANAHHLGLPNDAATWDKDTLLQLLMSFLIEPQLGLGHLHVLRDFPASQAALAKTRLADDEPVGCRFEIYYKGIELCNGYHELTDPIEQRKRLEQDNAARLAAGKNALKIDEKFLDALESGLPECCGVAVGFDRLMMLRHNLTELRNILPFTWEES